LRASQLSRRVSICDDLGQEVIGYVRERLAHFEALRSVDFVEQLPRTETGKLLKRELQQAFNDVDWALGGVSLRADVHAGPGERGARS
jgi:acyl-coenzyme A synthetase/AMP-(fatty) acid ligase